MGSGVGDIKPAEYHIHFIHGVNMTFIVLIAIISIYIALISFEIVLMFGEKYKNFTIITTNLFQWHCPKNQYGRSTDTGLDSKLPESDGQKTRAAYERIAAKAEKY